MIDVHAHAVLAGVMGCAGHYGPELGVGPEGRPRFRVGDYVLDGVDYTGTPFMDPDVRLRVNDHLGIELQVALAQPDHVLPPHRGRDRGRVLSLAQRRARRRRGRPPRPVPRLRPAPDAGHRRRDRPSCAAASRTSACSAPTSAPTSRPTSTTSGSTRSGRRASTLDVPVFIHPAPAGIDGPLRDPRVRKYDLDLSLGFLLRGDVGGRLLDLRRRARPPPDLDICMSHGGGASALHARPTRPSRAQPTVGPGPSRRLRRRRCGACGSTTTCTTRGRWRCSATRSAATASSSGPTSPAGTPRTSRTTSSSTRSTTTTPGGCCASTVGWAEVAAAAAVSSRARRLRRASGAAPGRTGPARRGSRPT